MQHRIESSAVLSFSNGILCVLAIVATLFLEGCTPATPQQRLSGHWVGAPNVAADVTQGIAAAGGGQPVQPALVGAAQYLGQLAANTVLAVDLHLNPSGLVLIRGNAAALGLPPDSDGKWRIQSAEGEIYQHELDVNGKKIDAKLILVTSDEFTLKLNVPIEKSEPGKAEPTEVQPQQPNPAMSAPQSSQVTMTFKRSKT